MGNDNKSFNHDAEPTIVSGVCKCECHDFREGVVMHMMPCCYPCKFCGKNIVPGHTITHAEQCSERPSEETKIT